jgi:uncharacterized protein YsxB (DUF464 family)
VIRIKIKQTESDCLIEVHGHAHYASIGKDIVCSAISVLFLTLTPLQLNVFEHPQNQSY